MTAQIKVMAAALSTLVSKDDLFAILEKCYEEKPEKVKSSLCQAKTLNGQCCKKIAKKDTDFCALHTPKTDSAMEEDKVYCTHVYTKGGAKHAKGDVCGKVCKQGSLCTMHNKAKKTTPTITPVASEASEASEEEIDIREIVRDEIRLTVNELTGEETL